MGKVNKGNYWWHALKMRWLVPNRGRAVGPAYWAYRAWRWLAFNTDPDNASGALYKAIEWRDNTLAEWLTPHLANARRFLTFCLNENSLKALAYTANSFSCRSRDEHQYYFTGWASLLGKVKVVRSQWIGKDGKPENLFMWVLAHLGDGPEACRDAPKETRTEVFSGWVLTAAQLERAKAEIIGHAEFDWDYIGIFTDRLLKELEIDDKDAWRWRVSLENAVMRERMPDVKFEDMGTKDYDALRRAVAALTPDEARALVAKYGLTDTHR